MSTILVRRATADDVETLFDIRTSVRENHQSRAKLASIGVTPTSVAEMLNGDAAAWIAAHDGIAAAFSMAKGDEQTVFAVFVRPGYEGRGLGSAVLSAAEEWLWQRGAGEIWLTTGAEPEIRAHGFYARRGWRRTDKLLRGDVKYVKSRPGAGA